MMNAVDLEKMIEDTVEKVLNSEAAEFVPFYKDKVKEALTENKKVALLRFLMDNNGYVDKY